jgi:hypothetical protein
VDNNEEHWRLIPHKEFTHNPNSILHLILSLSFNAYKKKTAAANVDVRIFEDKNHHTN